MRHFTQIDTRAVCPFASVRVWSDLPRDRLDPASCLEFARAIALVSGQEPDAPPEPTWAGIPESAPGLLLEIPADINALRASTPDLANRWGTAVRQAFLAAFGAGDRAEGFSRDETPQGKRCYYVLRPVLKGDKTELGAGVSTNAPSGIS